MPPKQQKVAKKASKAKRRSKRNKKRRSNTQATIQPSNSPVHSNNGAVQGPTIYSRIEWRRSNRRMYERLRLIAILQKNRLIDGLPVPDSSDDDN